ncbi:hypothetical protein EUGRSUZ_G02000 [Eucalyptus grandis]|uniref:Uncharacterized protein n=2 Tax=Eucalyptus grandis TaxID=71139 RepID=A0ACC3K5T2_EUCGR|nr:hypothetical protein EUGRSUZ_G02000 [Eucalyptus grandis]
MKTSYRRFLQNGEPSKGVRQLITTASKIHNSKTHGDGVLGQLWPRVPCHARLTSRLLRSDTRDTAPHCETTIKLSCYPLISTHTPNRAGSPSFPLTKTIFRCLYTRPVEGRRGTSEGLDRARGKTLRL